MDKYMTFGIALIRVTTEQFAVHEMHLAEDTDIKLHINFRFDADINAKTLSVYCAVAYETNKNIFLYIEAGCHFAISPQSWLQLYDSDTNTLTVNKEVLRHLAMLTVGTCRGILHAKTENTRFSQYHIPTINVAELITEDSRFEFPATNASNQN
jgi:hypothetical protein